MKMRDHDGFTDSKHGSDDPVGRPRDHHGPVAPKRGTATVPWRQNAEPRWPAISALCSTVCTPF